MNNSQTTIYTLSEQRDILTETLAGELTKTIFKYQSGADAFEKLRNLIFKAKAAYFRRGPKDRLYQLDKLLSYRRTNLKALSGIKAMSSVCFDDRYQIPIAAITEVAEQSEALVDFCMELLEELYKIKRTDDDEHSEAEALVDFCMELLEELHEIKRIAAITDDAEQSEALADYCVVKVMADITDDIQHAVKVKEGVEIFTELCEIEHIAVVNEIQRIAAAEVSEPRWRITEGMRAVWQEIFNRDYLNPDRWEYAINFRYLYITHFRELECLARILGLQEFLKTIETPIDRMIREGREKDIIQILRLLKRRIATQRAAQEEGITQILRLLKMRIATQRGPSNPHA